MRAFVVHCATIAVLAGSVPNIVWAGSTGRRNTAIGVTALAVGAWSNGTGKPGRRNTAILTTAGAAVAWSRYNDKKKQEKRRDARRVVVYNRRPAVRREVVYQSRPGVEREVVYVKGKHDNGKHLGHYIGRGHQKHHHD